jgi:hypothetical protein
MAQAPHTKNGQQSASLEPWRCCNSTIFSVSIAHLEYFVLAYQGISICDVMYLLNMAHQPNDNTISHHIIVLQIRLHLTTISTPQPP